MKIGIDIGGSHIGVGLVEENGKIIAKQEKDLLNKEKENIKEIIIETIIQYVKEITEKNNIDINLIEYVGIAFPKSLRNSKIGKAVNLGINGFEIEEELKNKLKIPIYMRNDAKCAAICEKKYGSLKQYKNAVFLSIGTGIGGAAFLDNTLLGTPKNDLFKIGHITIKKDGIQCKCGKNGCFENYASITALKREVIKRYNISKEITGIELRKIIIENLQDEKMQEILDTYIEDFKVGLSNIINLFEPEAISIRRKFCIL